MFANPVLKSVAIDFSSTNDIWSRFFARLWLWRCVPPDGKPNLSQRGEGRDRFHPPKCNGSREWWNKTVQKSFKGDFGTCSGASYPATVSLLLTWNDVLL